ncbi:MAG TPA: hypothetical protein VNR11_09215 [Xanthobacteraceae bacterium]|nr:hypothetical protein [Xanthobacteraceae bacterium]
MTPSELVSAVAEALNIPEPELVQRDRRLAEAGLRTSGGRGASAPEMGFEDAAKLLIAGLSAVKYANTVATVNDLWKATLDPAPRTGRGGDLGTALVLQKSVEGVFGEFTRAIQTPSCSFGDALTALLRDCKSGQMEAFLGRKKSDWRQRFELKVVRPYAEAAIGFASSMDNYLEYHFLGAIDHDTNTEIVTEYRVSAIPLIKIAKRLSD